MTWSIFTLVILSAFFHASWNALLRIRNNDCVVMIMSVVSAAAGSVGIIALGTISAQSLIYLAISAIFHVGTRILGNLAYRHGNLSQVYPMLRGLVPLLIVALSAITGHDTVTTPEFLVLISMAFGISLVAYTKSWKQSLHSKVLVLCLLTAFSSAIYTLLDGIAVRLSGSVLAFTMWSFLFDGVGSIGLLLSLRQGNLAPIRQDFLVGTGAGLLQLLAWGLVVFAMSTASIPLVAALRETSLIFGMLISHFFLRERPPALRVVGAAVVMLAIMALPLAKQLA